MLGNFVVQITVDFRNWEILSAPGPPLAFNEPCPQDPHGFEWPVAP